ncbi:hypothetical protein [Paenibacillus sp. ACRRY]|uniref:hypothetical protein n=1 Tax=Paenibacillus sp. ACRRY TaxID=2918208 RepID=UPI001EF49A38|nr:hypothetical protein [Paenibacillus sp. ACRRY]MCG7383340.1 hypothetical protein [Paenibacillus sp. ACRRY]
MSNVNKPVIPVEVADAIEILREDEVPHSNENILLLRATGGKAECRVRAAEALRLIPFDTLLAALVNGYERELTGEERLAKAYRNIRDEYQVCLFDGSSEEISFANGMRYALDTLSIKIEGVNA